MNDDYKIHVGIRWVLYTDRYRYAEDRGCSQRQVSGRHIQNRCRICQEGRMLVREGLLSVREGLNGLLYKYQGQIFRY